jgi:putative endonuclease
MAKLYWVYILASRKYGALYIGITSDPGARIYSHRIGMGSEHAARYRTFRLESYENVWEAIAREKQLKKWRRAWKIDLIESANPNWDDLYTHL